MPDAAPLTRRTVVVVGAGAAGAGLLVAGCSTAAPAAAPAAPGTALGPVSDVPVGSAKIFDAQGVVVTQATAGSFAGFSTVCPHQGCTVASVKGDAIVCPCHGSTFALDGSVNQGPATTGLEPRPVAVDGDRITLA